MALRCVAHWFWWWRRGLWCCCIFFFFFQAEDGIRDLIVTGVQTCALPILSEDALRAARLVVDPGLHVLGWSRQQAIDYMLAHTAQSEAQATSEVDRYIITPGQATAYMIGRLEIERLRQLAATQLGSRFDVREFHQRILEDGTVPLPLLGEKIDRWIASAR